MVRKLWIELRSSLWFVPGLLVVVGAVLALIFVELDLVFARELSSESWKPWLNAGAEGARGMLTAIASSMITVAGVAFSITIVTLSLASTQYTPRILRNFMRDRANQVVLGYFLAVFTYCLIVLRTVRGGSEDDGGGFVPLLAVAFGLLLALLSIACLIFFIHHTAASIQASSILKSITAETLKVIDTLHPEPLEGEDAAGIAAGELERGKWIQVPAKTNGYLQHINTAALLEFAKQHGTTLRLDHMPGDFVSEGEALAGSSQELKDGELSALHDFFVIGDFRTVEQDAAFGIRQIVDIAMKALSPGVNDTSTAVSCLSYISAILSRLAQRRIESPFIVKDEDLRVIAPSLSFPELVATGFDEIRLSAAGNVTILLQSLNAIRRVAVVTPSAGRREVLLDHARLIVELADHSVASTYDRARICKGLVRVRTALGAALPALPDLPVQRAVVPWI